MLEDLDSIDWASLQHAYGNASDVPVLLRSLLSEEEQVRDNAIYELFGNIHHQGTIYETSSYAVPFLMEFLDCSNFTKKDDIAVLVICIAGYYNVDVPEKNKVDATRNESVIICQVRCAALPYIPQLLPYMQNAELVEACGYEFALMLSRYPEYFELTIPVLENAVAIQTEYEIEEEMQAILDHMKKCD